MEFVEVVVCELRSVGVGVLAVSRYLPRRNKDLGGFGLAFVLQGKEGFVFFGMSDWLVRWLRGGIESVEAKAACPGVRKVSSLRVSCWHDDSV